MDIVSEKIIDVRFSDTDAMAVVWHGNYLRYFEDGREDFGKKYKLEYLDMYNEGFFTPIVKSEINHKAPIHYGDHVKIVTKYIVQRASKIVFEYTIINTDTNVVCATGKTIQVFLSVNDRMLELNKPDFYIQWESNNLNLK